MSTIRQSIEVRVPAHLAYQTLSHFETYPQFMDDVEAVQQLDPTHLHWTTRMANRAVEWDAEITEQERGRCIAWHNTSGPTNTGRVDVEPVGEGAARVTITLHAEPEQVPGAMSGYTEQDMALRLKQDMARFKDMIEGVPGGDAGQGTAAGTTAGNAMGNATGDAANNAANNATAAAPVPMRHLGQMPQDTTAEEHGGVPTSDAIGRPVPAANAVQGATGAARQGMQQGGRQPAQQAGGQPPQAGTALQSAPQSTHQPPPAGGAAAVVGAAGGTDAAAGAHLSGSKGGPGGPSLRETADASGVPGTPGGSLQGDAVTPVPGSDAVAGTGLGAAATADDARTGTGTASGSGTALTGGGGSGGRDAGIGGGGAAKP
ncbi:MAG TPA: SRPBCC family protein [Noviherbaspirillum sp.]|jgi:hypothetical protein|uniref:SRPBCC family protein n=1 Tax=Noviherbaspirillum sp. TaxID=1926288 RepID=UPI002F924297